jgi:plastocyanin
VKRLSCLALALVAAGCGGKAATSPTAPLQPTTAPRGHGAQQFLLSTPPNGDLRFDTRNLRTAATRVTLVLTNASSVRHGIAIKGNGVDSKGQVVGKNGKSSVTATLKPGTYTFYCPVHPTQMTGKLVVSPSG